MPSLLIILSSPATLRHVESAHDDPQQDRCNQRVTHQRGWGLIRPDIANAASVISNSWSDLGLKKEPTSSAAPWGQSHLAGGGQIVRPPIEKSFVALVEPEQMVGSGAILSQTLQNIVNPGVSEVVSLGFMVALFEPCDLLISWKIAPARLEHRHGAIHTCTNSPNAVCTYPP